LEADELPTAPPVGQRNDEVDEIFVPEIEAAPVPVPALMVALMLKLAIPVELETAL
jgi:hypothetical protein